MAVVTASTEFEFDDFEEIRRQVTGGFGAGTVDFSVCVCVCACMKALLVLVSPKASQMQCQKVVCECVYVCLICVYVCVSGSYACSDVFRTS